MTTDIAAAQLAAIRERANEYALVVNEWMRTQAGSDEYFLLSNRIEEMEGQAIDDRAALLGIVEALQARNRALEAAVEALREIAEARPDHADGLMQYPIVFGHVRSIAFNALAAFAGNGGA